MSSLYQKLKSKEESLAIVGLGYVGMPLAVAFSKKVNTIGFDISQEKIHAYKQGIDPTNEVGNHTIRNCSVNFTYDETKLKTAKFLVVVKNIKSIV